MGPDFRIVIPKSDAILQLFDELRKRLEKNIHKKDLISRQGLFLDCNEKTKYCKATSSITIL